VASLAGSHNNPSVSRSNPKTKESIFFLQITSVSFVILLIETFSPTLRILLVFCRWKRRYARTLSEILGSWFYFDRSNWKLEFEGWNRPENIISSRKLMCKHFRMSCREFKSRSIAPVPSYMYIYMHGMMKTTNMMLRNCSPKFLI